MFQNTIFAGSYDFFKYVLKKYRIYKGQPYTYFRSNGYKCCRWNYTGVPTKVWNLLHKDLTILSLSGLIEFENLEQLKNEYKSSRKAL
jgi:hypothetical protein